MYLSLGVPAVLPLGLITVKAEEERKICLMGVTLQHPPTQIFAFRTDGFALTGARAQDALPYAESFMSHHRTHPSVTLELEQATLKFMGLGANPLIALGVGRALAWASDLEGTDSLALARALDIQASHALELWAFDRGGLLWVETPSAAEGMPQVHQRHAIEHAAKREDWVFVFHFPPVPFSTPSQLGIQRRRNLLQVVPHLDLSALDEASAAVQSGIEEDQLDLFADALKDVIAINRAALKAGGRPYPQASEEDREVLRLMKEEGAVLADRTPMGLGRFALIEGAEPSLRMRTRMRAVLGYARGTITATITDNEGARQVVRDEPVRMRFLRSDMDH